MTIADQPSGTEPFPKPGMGVGLIVRVPGVAVAWWPGVDVGCGVLVGLGVGVAGFGVGVAGFGVAVG